MKDKEIKKSVLKINQLAIEIQKEAVLLKQILHEIINEERCKRSRVDKKASE